MRKLNQTGEVNGLLISTIVLSVLFVAVSTFLVMTYGKYADARDNVDAKVAAAVKTATDSQKAQLDKEFFEKEKEPLTFYEAAAKYGSIKVLYPKTWSAYVAEIDGQTPIDGYFHPKFVPAPQLKIKYALRLQLLDQQYATHLRTYNEKLVRGTLKAEPITINTIVGTKISGKLTEDTTGIVVALPLRDKTLKIWTESPDYFGDFNDTVLKNLTFTP